MSSKSTAKYNLCRCRCRCRCKYKCRCKINNLIKEKRGLPLFFVLHALLSGFEIRLLLFCSQSSASKIANLFQPCFAQTSTSKIAHLFQPCFAQGSAFLKLQATFIPACLNLHFFNVSDALSLYLPCIICYLLFELSYCGILALGLTKRSLNLLHDKGICFKNLSFTKTMILGLLWWNSSKKIYWRLSHIQIYNKEWITIAYMSI